MSHRDSEVGQAVAAWLTDEVNSADGAELRALSDAAEAGDQAAGAELADRFAAPLTFGTAGLRGPLRAGPNGMNATVVRRAAAGLGAWLNEQGHAGRRVVVGFDGRHRSHEFAADSAAILAAAGFGAQLMPRVLPTPLLAFAVRRLDAAAGVMVTASHNPPQDNGYKVYADDGAQIIPPADTQIEAAITALGPTRDIPLAPDRVRQVAESVVDDYVADIARLVPPGPRQLVIVHSAMHGVGTEVARRVFAAAGFAEPISVPQQSEPDPDFPTVAFPNPEEPGAIDLAVALARERGADLVIANDPDADRCAVAVPAPDAPGGWRMLRGDEVGVLLADALLTRGRRGTYATTIVSCSMLGAMAQRHDVGFAQTLTGFKWIMRAAPDLVYGYEEALGYSVAPDLVRDKDGISAAVLVAQRAAELAAAGSSLTGRLDQLAADYGRYGTDQLAIRVNDLAEIATMMQRARTRPALTLLDEPVTVQDLLPEADVLRWSFATGRVVIRPSGTEPKLKAYLEVVVADGAAPDSAAVAADRLARLRGEVQAALGA